MRDAQESTLSILAFMAEIAKLGVNVDCIECSGPGLQEIGQLLQDTNDSEGFTRFANGLFDFLNALVEGQYLQVVIDRALNDAPKKCPHKQEYDPDFQRFEYDPFDSPSGEDELDFFIAVLVVLAIIIAISLAIVLSTKAIVRRRHRKWVENLPIRQVDLLLKDQHREDGKEDQLNGATNSMFRSSEAIPAWLRYSMPIIILGNIAFFLSGHLSLGASVTVMFSIAGQEFAEEGFFEFSMARSTIEIWKGT